MRKQLSKSEIKELNPHIERYGLVFSKKDKIEILNNEIILVNSIPTFFIKNDKYVPTLKAVLNGAKLKQIIIDMGAVKFIAGGADVMRPGITGIDENIEKGDLVVIVDANNKKPLSIGESLFSSDELKNITSGKVIKNLHFVGDEIWKTA